MWKRVLFVVAAGVLLYGILVFNQWQTGPLKVSGTIEADEIRVGSRVGGRVAKVFIQEGHVVQAGDKLVQLEPFNLLERQAEAQAQLAARTAEYERLSAGFREEERKQAEARVDELDAELRKLKNGPRPEELEAARHEVERARAQYELALEEHRRRERLLGQQAIAQEQYDRSKRELRVTQETLKVNEQQLLLLENGSRAEDIDAAEARLKDAREALSIATSGYRKEEIAEALAARQAAEAALSVIKQEVAELTVTAPAAAVVQAVDLQPGDLVGANVPAISLIDLGSMWVRGYVPQSHLSIKEDQPVWVTADSLLDQVFAGHVSFISRQGEFTPRNVQTPEERSKQVFRIKVTLDEGKDRLRPGMAVDVWFEKP